MKRFTIKIIPFLLAALLVLAGCGAAVTPSGSGGSEKASAADDSAKKTEGSTKGSEATAPANTESAEDDTDEQEQDPAQESSAAEDGDTEIMISLNGDSAESDGSGVSISGSAVTITEGGTYVLSGTLDDGYVAVDADKEEKVTLVLDGVTINSEDFAAIYVVSADKVIIKPAEGTTSTLSNGGSFEPIDDSNVDAVIFARDDVTFNGEGTLVITSPAGHGIVGKDDVKIKDGSYEIDAYQTAIKANDTIEISGGTFSLTAGSDGLHAENNDDDTLGDILITGGDFRIYADDDAIHATTVLQIDDGTFEIYGAEGLEATVVTVNGGDIYVEATDDGINAAHKSSAYYPLIEINGGYITVVMGAGDTDGVDSNGDIVINGGTVDVTGRSTFDCDGSGVINGGTVIANGQEVSTLPNQMMGGGGFGPGGMRPR